MKPSTPLKRIGLVGCGTIGSRIAHKIREDNLAAIDFVADLDPGRPGAAAPGS